MQLQGLGGGPAVGAAAGQALATTLPQFIQNDLSNRLQAASMIQPWAQNTLGMAGLTEGALGRNLQEANLWNQSILGLSGQAQGEQGRNLEEANMWTNAALGLGNQAQGQMGRNLQEAQMWNQTALGLGSQAQGDEQLTQSAAKMSADIGNQEAMRQLQAMQVSGNLLTGLSQPLSQLGGLTQQQQQLLLQGLQGAGTAQQGTAQQGADSELMDWLRRQGLAESSSTGLFGSSVIPPSLTSATKSSGGK
jgi:hypothetical protein